MNDQTQYETCALHMATHLSRSGSCYLCEMAKGTRRDAVPYLSLIHI